MKLIRWLYLVLTFILLAACSNGSGNGNGGNSTLMPTPLVATTHTPRAEAAMSAYLDALMVEDYAAMYNMLTQSVRASISQDDFTTRYESTLAAISVSQMEYSILSTLTNPGSAQVTYRIIYHSSLYGDFQHDMTAHFSLENGQWRLQWDESLILPELAGGNKLLSDYRIPARGDIYDRSGNALVTQTNAVAIGLVAGQIPPDNEEFLFTELWRLTGTRPEAIRSVYESYPSGYYVPVGEASQETVDSRYNFLSAFSGLQLSAYTSRYYYTGSQAIGYTQAIFPEELDAYRRLGYSGGERVGKIGVEKWGEPYLAGKNGATLYLVDANGNIGNSLAQTESEPAASIYLTINKDFQEQAQQAMDGLPGAIVVLERDTGRVLAMVSSPGFDPNLFDPNNYNSMNLANMVNDPNQPLYNRASQGQYPLGSVFKVVTMAAALESGAFTPESTYDCQYDFTELGPTHILHDWTWEHCQNQLQEDPTLEACTTKPSGMLTLPQGLMRSCDPWFFHIGFTLFNLGKTTAISDMARGFGLGEATGIQQVAESEGQIPVPGDGVQATSLAVGQGNMQVTPLQVADFMAAIGNGGTLYRPQLVEKIVSVGGETLLAFHPEVRGVLPLKQENLKVIQDAMREVVENPRGTAYFRLSTLDNLIPMAGKTGTVETGFTEPHAWFAGYTLANRQGKPDIAIAVVVENKGEGSDWAAPIFRRIVEIYFYGKPQSVYWWESGIGIVRTPTPQGQETPTP
jgi:cell division protein FtsI/penicillin-binding protein 2